MENPNLKARRNAIKGKAQQIVLNGGDLEAWLQDRIEILRKEIQAYETILDHVDTFKVTCMAEGDDDAVHS